MGGKRTSNRRGWRDVFRRSAFCGLTMPPPPGFRTRHPCNRSLRVFPAAAPLGRAAALLASGCLLAACDRHSADELPESYGHGSSHQKSYTGPSAGQPQRLAQLFRYAGDRDQGGRKAAPTERPAASPASTRRDIFSPTAASRGGDITSFRRRPLPVCPVEFMARLEAAASRAPHAFADQAPRLPLLRGAGGRTRAGNAVLHRRQRRRAKPPSWKRPACCCGWRRRARRT